MGSVSKKRVGKKFIAKVIYSWSKLLQRWIDFLCGAPHKLIIQTKANDFDCLDFSGQARYGKSKQWKSKSKLSLI
jgi:hypothetical protein